MAHVISEECIACGACLPECPDGAISEGDIYVIDVDICTDCGTCVTPGPSKYARGRPICSLFRAGNSFLRSGISRYFESIFIKNYLLLIWICKTDSDGR